MPRGGRASAWSAAVTVVVAMTAPPAAVASTQAAPAPPQDPPPVRVGVSAHVAPPSRQDPPPPTLVSSADATAAPPQNPPPLAVVILEGEVPLLPPVSAALTMPPLPQVSLPAPRSGATSSVGGRSEAAPTGSASPGGTGESLPGTPGPPAAGSAQVAGAGGGPPDFRPPGPGPPPENGNGPKEVIDRVAARAFPLGLLAAVALFLLVQSRIDRRDPKLAASPMTDEVLGFS